MPVTFRQIANNTASVTLQLGADTITIVYYPNRITDKMIAEINDGITKDNEMLEQLIQSWDVYEDDEHTVMFPLNRINEFGIPFKQQVGEAIGQAIRPNSVTPQKI
jgi:hypothetical protein